MFSNGRSAHVPYLQEYLQYLLRRNSDLGRKVGILGGIFGAVAGVLGGLAGAFQNQIGLQPENVVAVVLGLQAFAWGGIGIGWWFLRRQELRKAPEVPLANEARRIAPGLLQSIEARRFHRDIHPAAMEVFEANARNWKRVQEALNGPFWSGNALPEHWQRVREQASLAADQAMAETVVLLETAFRPAPAPTGLASQISHALESVGLKTPEISMDLLPVEYHPAVEVGRRLADLADEAEAASRAVIKESTGAGRFTAATNLEDTLRNLRQVREAESEIQQDLRS